MVARRGTGTLRVLAVPSSVHDVFAGAGLEPAGAVRWGEPVPPPVAADTGIYVVALAEHPLSREGVLPRCPIDASAVDDLVRKCSRLTLDDGPTSGGRLAERLASFWLPDEVVLYVGLSGQPLRSRVRQYYRTPLGARRPHAGGWWLKTLTVLPELWVHFASTPRFKEHEQQAFNAFVNGVSRGTRSKLHDSERLMPFANLEYPPGRRKAHGLRGATVA